jgi:hypothetical protein
MLPQSADNYRIKLSDIFLDELLNSKTEKQQKELLERYSSKITKLKYISSSDNFIVSCLQYTRSFNGDFKLFNQDIFHNYVERSSEGDALRNLSDVMSGNVEEIGLLNGQIVKFRIFQSANPIAAFERKPDGTLYFARFQNGILSKEEFYNYAKGINYIYEFENGKNKTLMVLDASISDAEVAMKKGNYQEALYRLENNRKNPYPVSIAQNIKIQSLINDCNVQINLQRKKEEDLLAEQERLVELQRRKDELSRQVAESKVYNISVQEFSDNSSSYIGLNIEVVCWFTNATQRGGWGDTRDMTLRMKDRTFEQLYSILNFYKAEGFYWRQVEIDGNKVKIKIREELSNRLPNSTNGYMVLSGKVISASEIEVNSIERRGY